MGIVVRGEDPTDGQRWPRGWFRVALGSELRQKEPLAVRLFGRDLVAFRDGRGIAHVLDGVCPHLGAPLGSGTVVDGCVRCPFHRWAFDGSGRCVSIPFASKIPPRAVVRSWPVAERDGVVFVWHDASGASPDFEIASVPEIGAGWSSPRPFRRHLRARLIDVKENIVDVAHFPALHRAAVMGFEKPPRVLRRWTTDVSFHMDVETEARLFGFPMRSRIRFDLHGPGIEDARVLSPVPLLLRFLTTPIDDGLLDFMVLAYAPRSRIPFLPWLQAAFFRRRVAREVAQDARIWERKAFQPRPVLSEADGPIVALRTWLSRFYEPRPAQEPRLATLDG
ncbi:MAG: ksha1 [bacterium]|nr:ksha1 [bacterium]